MQAAADAIPQQPDGGYQAFCRGEERSTRVSFGAGARRARSDHGDARGGHRSIYLGEDDRRTAVHGDTRHDARSSRAPQVELEPATRAGAGACPSGGVSPAGGGGRRPRQHARLPLDHPRVGDGPVAAITGAGVHVGRPTVGHRIFFFFFFFFFFCFFK